MKTIKLKVFINRILDINSIIDYAQAYNLKHKIDLHIDIQHIDVKGYKSNYVEVRPNQWQWILQGAENLVATDPEYDGTMFMFDQQEWKTPLGSPYPLRVDVPSSDCVLVNGKPFINLGLYSPDLNGTEITFCHELMHMYKYMALAEGYAINDTMDMMFVNGVPEPYYFNDQPDNVNGNFINMWEQFFNTGFLKIE